VFEDDTADEFAAAIDKHRGQAEFAAGGYTFYKLADEEQVMF